MKLFQITPILAVITASNLSLGQAPPAPAGVVPPAVASGVSAKQYAAASDLILDHLETYNQLVGSVKDLATAKAAKPKLEVLTAKMRSATDAAAALGTVSPDIEKTYSQDPKNLARAEKIQGEMAKGARVIVLDKAIFAELQPTLALFQRAMRRNAPAQPSQAPAPAAPAQPTTR